MEIDFSPLIGQTVTAEDVEVTDRQIMMFAAAVGETAPHYLDDTGEDGVIAPPTFGVTRSWPLVTRLQERFGDVLPASALSRLVHGAEQLALHRPIHGSDTLTITGRPVAIYNGVGGARLTVEVRALDADGGPVFTEHATLLFRGITHSGQEHAIADIPPLPSGPKDSPVVWTRPITVDRGAAHIYDACTGITFPIHTSLSFARAVGLRDIVLQGTATLALAVREICAAESVTDPRRVLAVAGRFVGMVVPGTTISLRLVARDGQDRHFEILDEGGRPAVSGGYARLA